MPLFVLPKAVGKACVAGAEDMPAAEFAATGNPGL
jgi:hypothetical protein